MRSKLEIFGAMALLGLIIYLLASTPVKVDASFLVQGISATNGRFVVKDTREYVCNSSTHYQSICLGILELHALGNADVEKILNARFAFKDDNGNVIFGNQP